MPFRAPTPPPRRSAPTNQSRSELLRAGGLYPSQTGTSLGGNIWLAEPRKGNDEPFGVMLIDLIQRCMEQQLPLRVLIFEDNGRFPNQPPYTVHFTEGRPRQEPAQQQGYTGNETQGLEAVEGEEIPEAEEALPPPPTEPAPRPIRRAAPRR